MNLEILIQILISAVCTGGLYGLFASGFTFQLGALKIVDVSYGSWMMVAMYGMYVLKVQLKINFLIALPILMIVYFFIGYAMRKFLFARCGNNAMVQMISTMAANFIIQNFAEFIFKQTPRSTGMLEKYINIGTIPVSLTRLGMLILSVAVMVGFQIYLNKTWTGRSIRSIVSQRQMAQVVGVNADKTINTAFGLSGGAGTISSFISLASSRRPTAMPLKTAQLVI